MTRYTQAVQSRGTQWPIKFNGACAGLDSRTCLHFDFWVQEWRLLRPWAVMVKLIRGEGEGAYFFVGSICMVVRRGTASLRADLPALNWRGAGTGAQAIGGKTRGCRMDRCSLQV